jgi:hypothetical protein
MVLRSVVETIVYGAHDSKIWPIEAVIWVEFPLGSIHDTHWPGARPINNLTAIRLQRVPNCRVLCCNHVVQCAVCCYHCLQERLESDKSNSDQSTKSCPMSGSMLDDMHLVSSRHRQLYLIRSRTNSCSDPYSSLLAPSKGSNATRRSGLLRS